MNVLLFLLIGLAAGYIASRVEAVPTHPRIALIVGVLGAVLGGFLLSDLGSAARGLFGSLITATAGATLLLLLVGILQRTARPNV